MPRNNLIQVRRDTAANWTSANPTLASGEIGLETDTGKLKIGTGSTAWTSLLYVADASDITGTALASNVVTSSLTTIGTLGSLNVSGNAVISGNVTVDTNTLKVDSTNNRVGIGTASPTQTLDVAGNITSSGSVLASSYIHGSDYLSPYQGFRNYLINGGFNIWQRGTSSASTGVTTADRWYNLASGTTTFSQDSSDFPTGVGVMYSNKWTTGASNSYGQIYQALESSTVIPLRGSTMTFSVWVKRGSTALTGNLAFSVYYSTISDSYGSQDTSVTTTTSTITPGTSWIRFVCAFTVPSNAVGLKVGIVPEYYQSSGVVVYFAGMQLERGNFTMTPFEQRPIGTELALCQRYYWSTKGATGSPYPNVGFGMFSSTTQANMSIRNPVPMRAVPTTISLSDLRVTDYQNTFPVDSASIATIRSSTLNTSITVPVSGATQYRPCALEGNNSVNAFFALGAEL